VTADRSDEATEVSGPVASSAGLAIAVVTAVASAAIVVYALGSARSWWEGSSCALASCGAEDIEWAWYTVAVVAAVVTGLLVVSAVQMVRDRRT
jgi:hypothetical protein